MNSKKVLCFISLLFALTLFAPYQGWAQLFQYSGGPTKPGTHAPMITHSFAVEKGTYGYIWKIYIEAEDSDGDMLSIAALVDQTGYGHYPTDWIYLKSPYQKYFKGYLQWNTFSSRSPHLREWTQITLKVSVIDKAGNESNEVVLPFTFESGVKSPYQYQLPAPFDRGDMPKLGHISVDLFEPRDMDGSHDNRD
jgi:hypothetical protein